MTTELSDRLSSRRAAIIPMMVVLVIPLLALLGLAIDTGILFSARNQQSMVTQSAALAAISQYIGNVNNPGGTCQCSGGDTGCIAACAAEQAVLRAEAVAKLNVTLVEKHLYNKDDPVDKFAAAEAGDDVFDDEYEGALEVGRYYYTNQDPTDPDSQSGPCDSFGGAPCFVPRPKNSVDNNAIRFSTWVKKTNPIKTVFLKLIGIDAATFRVSAVATLIPRNDVFLIDLSRSIVESNYGLLKYDDPGTPDVTEGYVEFNYVLDESHHASARNGFPAHSECPEPAGQPGCHITGADGSDSQEDWNNTLFSRSEAAPVFFPDQVPNDMHFRNEYRVFDVNFDSANMPGKYIIHTDVINESGVKTGNSEPQPLFSVLKAVKSGMDIILNRGLGSDYLGIYGFDSEGKDSASYDGYNVSVAPRMLDLSVPSINPAVNPQFADFYASLDTETNPHKYIEKGLFPVPGAYSDLQAAFFLALNKISQSKTYKSGRNSIFMFTDGLANCPHHTHTSDDGATTLYWVYRQGQRCDNRGRYIIENIRRMLMPDYIRMFQNRKIAISIALVGANSAPHYLARGSYTKYGCVDQAEANADKTIQFVDSGFTYYDNLLENNPDLLDQEFRENRFYAPNELYKLVRETSGLWIPILPQAVDNTGLPVKFFDELSAACESLADGALVRGCDPEQTNCQSGLFTIKDHATGQTVVDSHGRVLFDPHGRSIEEQMQQAMEQVLNSPFTLVQ